jgi:hypothetical protein
MQVKSLDITDVSDEGMLFDDELIRTMYSTTCCRRVTVALGVLSAGILRREKTLAMEMAKAHQSHEITKSPVYVSLMYIFRGGSGSSREREAEQSGGPASQWKLLRPLLHLSRTLLRRERPTH